MKLKPEIRKKIKNGFLNILEKLKFWKWNTIIWTTLFKKVVPIVTFILSVLSVFIMPVRDWLLNMLGVTYPMWIAVLGYWCIKKKPEKVIAYGMIVVGFGMMVFYAAHEGIWFKDFGAQTLFEEFFFRPKEPTLIKGEWVEPGTWVGVELWANGGIISVFFGIILGTWFGKGIGVLIALTMLFIGAWNGFTGIKKWIEKKLGFRFRGRGIFKEWLEGMFGGREIINETIEYEEEEEIAPRIDGDIVYFPPSLNCLNELEEDDGENLEKQKDRSREVERTLGSLGVNSKVVNVRVGPTLTRYELEIGEETQVKNVKPLETDLAMRLSVKKVRVEAPIPETSLIGVEIPNEKRDIVGLRELISLGNRNNVLELPIGKNVIGEPFHIDFKDIPHLLIAGSTGSGKSVCIHNLIVGLLYKASYMNVKMILIDPKRVEFSLYKGIPHLMRPIVTETKEAIEVFEWATEEMDKRYAEFEKTRALNIDDFIEDGGQMERIFIFVEEFADLMQTSNKEIEGYIQRLAQKGRASGIHIILATQRPDSKTIIGPIKTNFLNRIAMSMSSRQDSGVALGIKGAEQLLGHGDMLYSHNGGSECSRIQGCLVTPKEIKCVVDDVIAKNPIEEIVVNKAKEKRDEFYEEARTLVIDKQKASAKMFIDAFGIGTGRANKLLNALEKNGIVGPSVGTKPRKVLISESDLIEED